MKTLWARLGVTINVTDEQAEKILKGDQETLLEVLDPKRMGDIWRLDGETYFPEEANNGKYAEFQL